MQLLLKFDIETNKKDISANFWNAHNDSWKNNEKPTNTEFKTSIKNEIDSWLEDLEIDFEMQELPTDIAKTDAFGVDLIINAVNNANYKTDITKAEAFNAIVEGMKILDWDKKL